MLSDITVSIVSSFIYDILKSISVLPKKTERTFSDEISAYIKSNLDEEFDDLTASGVLDKFLRLPLVSDTFCNYMYYIITGKIMEDMPAELKPTPSASVSKMNIVNFFSKNLIKDYEKSGVQSVPARQTIDNFFIKLIDLCEDYIYKITEQSENFTAYFINRNMNEGFLRIENRFDELCKVIFGSLKREVTATVEDFENIRKKYMEILKSNNSTAHIYLLDKFGLDSFYIPPRLVPQSIMISKKADVMASSKDFLVESLTASQYAIYTRHTNKRMAWNFHGRSWQNIFGADNIVYITGGAGYGKSLFMQKLICDSAKLNVPNADDYLVIYGELKMFFTRDSKAPMSVPEFLQTSMVKQTLLDKEIISKEFINYYLDRGRCFILLDALDEVDKNKRASLHSAAVNFFKAQNPNNKICITSRSRGFIPEKNIEVLEIKSLDREQITAYVDKIIALGKFDKNDREAFIAQSEVLVDRGFLSSFLVLSLLINIYKAERELPENKLELYQKCFEVIANKREKEKSHERYDWNLISTLMKDNTFMELANLCLPNNSDVHKDVIKEHLIKVYKTKYMSENQTDNAIENFLTFCSDRTELFVPSTEEDCFKFFHRSFFEYFYSLYIFTRMSNVKDIYKAMEQFDVDSEVFELTTAMFKQKNELKYQEIIEYIFEIIENDANSQKRLNALNILILCMQVVDDAVYKTRFVDFLAENREFIVKNTADIANQWIIKNIIYQNPEYDNKISEAYRDDMIFCVIRRFLSFTYGVFKEGTNLERSLRAKSIARHIMQNRTDSFFETDIYRHISVSEIVNSIDENTLQFIKKNYCVHAFVKGRVLKQFKEFLSMPEEYKNDLKKAIKDYETDYLEKHHLT